jgi:hypothetical protein
VKRQAACEHGNANRPHNEHASDRNYESAQLFDRAEPHARIKTQLEIQQDEAGGNRDQAR